MKTRQAFLTVIVLLALVSLSCNLSRTAAEQMLPPPPTEVLQASEEASPAPPEAAEEPTEQAPTEETTATESPPAPTGAPPVSGFKPGPCEQEVCILEFKFPLGRPIAPPGRVTLDPSYRFESSDHGKRDPHHGVEFLNSQGTPVIAAADGEVVVAGDDLKTTYGLFPNMYGNLVVLQHTFPDFDVPVFTLYAHLYSINVQVGDQVKAGEEIGEVGRTGSSTGSHLHFEVRYGENVYAAARNPELWMQPLPDEDGQPGGALAGRILDGQGDLLVLDNIVLEHLAGAGSPPKKTYYLNTYSENRMVGLEPWEESFAIGDLPPGEYQVSFFKVGMQQFIVTVEPGKLTLVNIQVGAP
jgi:murein DD-endopeptidase MepM/ murein hydrolase activator NlpD